MQLVGQAGSACHKPARHVRMNVLLTTLFSLPSTMALDVNDEGGMLVLYDGTGVRQVSEIAPTARWRALTELG